MHVRGFMFADTRASRVVADDVRGVDHFEMFETFKHHLITTQDVYLGREERTCAEETSLVYQYGTALSDAALTKLVLSKAEAAGVGTVMPHSGPRAKDWALEQVKSSPTPSE